MKKRKGLKDEHNVIRKIENERYSHFFAIKFKKKFGMAFVTLKDIEKTLVFSCIN